MSISVCIAMLYDVSLNLSAIGEKWEKCELHTFHILCSVSVRVPMSHVHVCVCVCVCVCICMCIYMCACLCVCVYVNNPLTTNELAQFQVVYISIYQSMMCTTSCVPVFPSFSPLLLF